MQRKAAAALRYSIGPASVMGGYRWGFTEFANGATLSRDDFWWAGGSYQATTALNFQLGYYYWNIKSLRLGATATEGNPANPWEVAFVADYAFSKRTDVYLTTAYARNAGVNFDSSNTGFATGYFPTPGQRGMTAVAVGGPPHFLRELS
ncbi:porin [Cupriavidus necator]|nr:porin [Cupriavidus necator]